MDCGLDKMSDELAMDTADTADLESAEDSENCWDKSHAEIVDAFRKTNF